MLGNRTGNVIKNVIRNIFKNVLTAAIVTAVLVSLTGCGIISYFIDPGTEPTVINTATPGPSAAEEATDGDITEAPQQTGTDPAVTPLPLTPEDPMDPANYPLTSAIKSGTKRLLDVYGRSFEGIYNIVNDPGRAGTPYFHYDYDDALTSLPGYEVLAEHILNEGHGVCYHYAALTYYLLRECGYNACIIHGYRVVDNALHYWTMVETDQGWYHFDPLHHQMLLTDFQKSSDDYTRGNGLSWEAGKWPESAKAFYVAS